jgi:uroporphyrin-III C-methyltransferase
VTQSRRIAPGGRAARGGSLRFLSSASDESASAYYSSSAAGPEDVGSLLELYLSKAEVQVPSASDISRSGKVYLVGTGPGDPGLLTLKAFHLMQTADVVMYDRLVSPAILDLVHDGAHMLYVGKQAGFHTRTQAEIEKMLIGFAGMGASVVRLKGGDPLVFGRGGEEMETLMSRGYSVQIVPGITAAAGVGSALGIPLTHRGTATSVRLLTGHLREGARPGVSGVGADPVDFAVTSADLETTLVVYMGLGTLPALAERLIESGFPRDTPAVAVERGTTERERRVFSALENLPAAVVSEKFQSPTLLVVGETVELSPFWPWRDICGKPLRRSTDGETHAVQKGAVGEECVSWFRKDSRTVSELRLASRTNCRAAESSAAKNAAPQPERRNEASRASPEPVAS